MFRVGHSDTVKFTLTLKTSFHILNSRKGKYISMVITEDYPFGRCK